MQVINMPLTMFEASGHCRVCMAGRQWRCRPASLAGRLMAITRQLQQGSGEVKCVFPQALTSVCHSLHRGVHRTWGGVCSCALHWTLLCVHPMHLRSHKVREPEVAEVCSVLLPQASHDTVCQSMAVQATSTRHGLRGTVCCVREISPLLHHPPLPCAQVDHHMPMSWVDRVNSRVPGFPECAAPVPSDGPCLRA